MMMGLLDDMRAQIQLLCAGDISDVEKRILNPESADVLPFRPTDEGEPRDQ